MKDMECDLPKVPAKVQIWKHSSYGDHYAVYSEQGDESVVFELLYQGDAVTLCYILNQLEAG